MTPKRPDHKVVVKRKGTKYWSQIGAGWSTEFGGINLKLNPFVTLSDHEDFYIAIRPVNDEEDLTEGVTPTHSDEDVPF